MESDTLSQVDVIRWIHSVEYEKHVRMAGLITELYFSKKLQHAQLNGDFSCIAEGWFYTTPVTDSLSVRHWYRIADSNPQPSAVELAFFDLLKANGHRFFFLGWDIQLAGNDDCARPEITINAIEWVAQNTHQQTIDSAAFQKQANENLTAYLSKISFEENYGWNSSTPFSDWLGGLDSETLKSLFVQRCLMNSLKDLIPLDLDAMALRSNGELVFLEFKRKYPAPGCSLPRTSKDQPANYYACAKEMERAMQFSKIEVPMARFKAECRLRNFVYVQRPSFGLDMHHFETMMLCEEVGIEYRYVIWNAGRTAVKEERTLQNTLRALKGFLEIDITPVELPVWWTKPLRPSDVIGLTFTSGNDSGSYSNRIRLQVTFDATP